MVNQYNLNFEELCNLLELGEIVEPPQAVSGGHLHKMFALKTTKGKYAVKALNPQIMARPTALSNYIKSESIVSVVSNHVSAQPAKVFNGTFLQNVENQDYLVFDWINGHTLKMHQISTENCKKIGALLADIHSTDFSSLDCYDTFSCEVHQIDWRFYLSQGIERQCIWVEHLFANIQSLMKWSIKAKQSSDVLKVENVFSHRDLEPKNVMWEQDCPIIIDWESAGEINPNHDLVETAIYWSISEFGEISKEKFDAFISGYIAHKTVGETDWKVVLDLGYLSKLEWLEYSLKRSLNIESTDQSEQEMGTNHVIDTINGLKNYEQMVSVLELWMKENQNSVSN